ncbi:MAG: DUF6261 family protein [Bacteroidales bacterium]|nr:DUF6261 family protein [Bacteroidales bacterium]
MSVEVSRLPLKELWNSEYTIFVDQISKIVAKYNVQDLHLKKSFDRVSAFLPSLAKVTAQELSSQFSNSLKDLDNERDSLINGIIAQVKTMSKITIPALATQAAVLSRLFDKHGRDIATAGYNAETKRINDLLSDYHTKAEIKTAVDAISLTLLFDQLAVVNTQFEELFLQRNEDDATTESVDARALRSETDKAITAFFDAIVFCSSEYDELDYTPLANELNEVINYYKTHLKARSTRRSNSGNVSSETPIEPKA